MNIDVVEIISNGTIFEWDRRVKIFFSMKLFLLKLLKTKWKQITVCLGSSMINCELMQYRSVAVKGCSFWLFNKDQTTLVQQNVPQYCIVKYMALATGLVRPVSTRPPFKRKVMNIQQQPRAHTYLLVLRAHNQSATWAKQTRVLSSLW